MLKKTLALLLAFALALGLSPAVFADDDGEDTPPRCELYVENNLSQMGYGDLAQRSEIAVGDTIEILYEDTVTADVYINGEFVKALEAGDRVFYFYKVEKAGEITVEVRRGEDVLLTKSFTVISSSEMYKKMLKEAFTLPSLSEIGSFSPDDMQGFPIGNPFLPLAFIVMTAVNFFSTVFAFTRIVR